MLDPVQRRTSAAPLKPPVAAPEVRPADASGPASGAAAPAPALNEASHFTQAALTPSDTKAPKWMQPAEPADGGAVLRGKKANRGAAPSRPGATAPTVQKDAAAALKEVEKQIKPEDRLTKEQLEQLVASDSFQGLSAEGQKQALGVFKSQIPEGHAAMRAVRDGVELFASPSFPALSAGDQKLAIAAMKGASDPAVATSLKKLIEDPKFASLKPDEKTAVLSQAANYPNTRSVDRMQQMLQKDWFQGMDLGDKQRALKVVAHLAQHPGDKTVIDNTLDRFLSPTGTYKLAFDAPSNTNGTAYGDTLHMTNSVPADNSKADTSSSWLDVYVNTPVHEVNHLVNGDTVSQTFDYFMQELHANYAQFRARYGREPDRKALAGMAQYLLQNYPDIKAALDGKSGAGEQKKVVEFMAGVLGWDAKDVTAANAATKAVNPAATTPLPKVPGDLDN